MGDVAERPHVDDGRLALQGLRQIGLHGVPQQRHQGADAAHFPGRHRLPILRPADHHVAQALAQIFVAGRQGQNGHDLRGGGDVEAALPHRPVNAAADAGDHLAQGPILRIRHPPPGDAGAPPNPATVLRWTALSVMAANRLWADCTAWKSPVKCRLMSAAGCTVD